MNERNRWVIGNWKMNGALATNASLLEALVASRAKSCSGATKVAVCAPFPYLTQLQRLLGGTAISYGAQDVSEHKSGAYTGQISAAMLGEFGVTMVLVGHSERRLYNAETSALVAAKATAAVAAGLMPVICVGETLAERESGLAEATVAEQLAPCAGLIAGAPKNVLIAYEPVWAIGTGKTATPAEAQAMHAFIRAELEKLSAAAADIPLLYGGSVKASNACELFSQPDIDGGLIGGASLIADDFLAIVSAA
ncbi:MAG: triose-phosphate isomerase [Casimicrobium sp.]